MVLLSTAFQYSRTTGLSHHDVSTFQRAIGSIEPVNAPEMDSGAPPGPRTTSIAAGGVSILVMLAAGATPHRRSVPAAAPARRRPLRSSRRHRPTTSAGACPRPRAPEG